MKIQLIENDEIILEFEHYPEIERTLRLDCDLWNLTHEVKREVHVFSPEPVLTLDQLRNKKIKEVDYKTQEVINSGFSFDNRRFSLSQNAQQKIMMIQLLLDKDLLDPSTPLSTKQEYKYDLLKENAQAFVAAAYQVRTSALLSGTILKDSILNMNEEELEEFEDNR